MRFTAYTGLRWGEVAAPLRVGDVDLLRGAVTVARSLERGGALKDTKTHSRRIVHLEARAHNWPWAQIAKVVGITRQSAHRRWRHLEAPARALVEEEEKRFRSSRWPPDAPWVRPPP